MKSSLSVCAYICLAFGVQPAANALDLNLGLGGRYYFSSPLYAGQEDYTYSAEGRLDHYWDFADRTQRIESVLFGRKDFVDDGRSHVDFRELYWWRDFQEVELFAGVQTVHWGVAESVNIVNVINQDDWLEDIEGDVKLGQPMLRLVKPYRAGTLSVYLMPWFRERQFPEERGRLRLPLPISDEPAYESDKEEKHLDAAIRWSQVWGNFDLGVSYFSGTNRDPYFIPVTEENTLKLQPSYSQLKQASVDLQGTLGSWLWKLELARGEDSAAGSFTAAVGGVELTQYAVAGSKWDLGWLMEFQYDNRSGVHETPYQRDLVLGTRIAFNDLAGSQFLAAISLDQKYGNRYLSIEANRRLHNDWEMTLGAKLFGNVGKKSAEHFLRRDDYLELVVRHYF